MKKREMILRIILIILIFMICIIIFTVNISYNKNKKINNNIDESYIERIKNYSWRYVKSYFYDGEDINTVVFDPFWMAFYETYVERCFGDECNNASYNIDDNILTIESTSTEIYKISFEGEYLVLDCSYVNEKGIIYYFELAKG